MPQVHKQEHLLTLIYLIQQCTLQLMRIHQLHFMVGLLQISLLISKPQCNLRVIRISQLSEIDSRQVFFIFIGRLFFSFNFFYSLLSFEDRRSFLSFFLLLFLFAHIKITTKNTQKPSKTYKLRFNFLGGAVTTSTKLPLFLSLFSLLFRPVL